MNWIRNRSAEDSCPTDQDRRTVRRKIGQALTANGPEPCLLPWFRQCRPPASRSRPAGVHSCLQRQRDRHRGEKPSAPQHSHLCYLRRVPPAPSAHRARLPDRSEEHTSELQSLMRISYAVFCLKKKKYTLNYLTLI